MTQCPQYNVGMLVLAFVAVLAVCRPAAAAAVVPDHGTSHQGFELSIMESTQGNIGVIGIGVGYVGGGPYLDENGVRREGLHASLEISVANRPSAYLQPDVHEGQTVEEAGYRILIERIIPEGRGYVIVRVWGPSP